MKQEHDAKQEQLKHATTTGMSPSPCSCALCWWHSPMGVRWASVVQVWYCTRSTRRRWQCLRRNGLPSAKSPCSAVSH